MPRYKLGSSRFSVEFFTIDFILVAVTVKASEDEINKNIKCLLTQVIQVSVFLFH